MTHISTDNHCVHGLWIGDRLSRLEMLTLHSFVRFGHNFHLWLYDALETPVPRNVTIRDANEILPRNAIFRNTQADPVSGVGKGSVGAFSDLFRYKLLYEHGGIWVDMDVTCLRGFDFASPYVFRPHRIGVVGNIMKCPPRSPLMRDTFAEAEATITPDSPWLAANMILNKHIRLQNLDYAIHAGICNEDSFHGAILPLLRHFRVPPHRWYAIHWVNEGWCGRQGADKPDKEDPPEAGLLHELYRLYSLLPPLKVVQVLPAPLTTSPAPLKVEPAGAIAAPPTLHVNMLIPTLVRGGAERIVLDIATALQNVPGATCTIYVQSRVQPEYPLPAALRHAIKFLDELASSAKTAADRLRALRFEILASPSSALFTHMIPTHQLAVLWDWGIVTIPVIHNAAPSWQDAAAAFNRPHIPFIIAVADSVAVQLRDSGCERPIMTIRHEIQRHVTAAKMMEDRHIIRDRHGIRPDTLLIGMVGQFKSQKAYTRAVRILAEMRHICSVRLMILGGWDHQYGSGRTAFEAACRLAVELGVIADMIMPGDVHPTEPYYAAFDVFLNTSIYEGLSISLLEAIAAACPIVAADAGGTREVLPPNGILVADGADIAAYVRGICSFLRQPSRNLPALPTDRQTIPLVWPLLARHAITRPYPRLSAPTGTLFVTANLHAGGAQRSLVNLLGHSPTTAKVALSVLGRITVPGFLATIREAGIRLIPLDEYVLPIDQAAAIADLAARLNMRNICFWNAPPEVKLCLAKILPPGSIRLIDVSPGPMLFDALTEAAGFQQRLAFDTRCYFARLDHFVAKYAEGLPPAELFPDPQKISIIPNGVPAPPGLVRLPPPELTLPRHFNPAWAIGTCCRLVPDKRLDFLIDMMAHLITDFPKCSLTVIGAPEGSSAYFQRLNDRIADEKLTYIRLLGGQDDVNRFLATFKIFVMVSNRQGCPNASLEAMAMGLPVISNRSGGIAEQVIDGVNGYLVDTPAEMAARTAELLRSPARRRQFGKASRSRAMAAFSMRAMVDRYQALLDA